MKILETAQRISNMLPTLFINLTSGGAGLFLPAPGSKSAASSLMNGDLEGAFHAGAYNYLGVDTYGVNSFGLMVKRAQGLKIAIFGAIAKTVYNDIKGEV